MVRIALMRMMADEERENAHNAACLTKFAELLVLNDILTTEQMWRAFSLVGDMYHSSGARGFHLRCHRFLAMSCGLLCHTDCSHFQVRMLWCCNPLLNMHPMQARGRRSCRRSRSGWSTPTS
jgi:hypothetical protein